MPSGASQTGDPRRISVTAELCALVFVLVFYYFGQFFFLPFFLFPNTTLIESFVQILVSWYVCDAGSWAAVELAVVLCLFWVRGFRRGDAVAFTAEGKKKKKKKIVAFALRPVLCYGAGRSKAEGQSLIFAFNFIGWVKDSTC